MMGHVMTHRGPRMQITVRLPIDEYREVALRARARGWSMSDYIGWAVAKELGGGKARGRRNPLGYAPHVQGGSTARYDPVAVDDWFAEVGDE